MHGRIQKWLAWTLAAAMGYGVSTVAVAQQTATPLLSTDATSYGYTEARPETYVASNSFAADDSDLGKRLADIEKRLKKYDDKAKADKETAASKMTCTPYGRLQVDTAIFNETGDVPYIQATPARPEHNGIEFRRIYVGMRGTGFDVMEYKMEVDLAGTGTTSNTSSAEVKGRVLARDVYLQINELPVAGHIRIGNFYEPFGLEQQTSDLYTTFMERANTHMLSPDRHIGIMAFDHYFDNDNATWAIGAFCSAGGDGGMIFQDVHDHAATAVTGRTTWLPWYDEATNGRGLLHVGVAATYRDAWNDTFPLPLSASASTRPEESHLGQQYYASLTNVDHVEEVGGELAYVYGPFSVQSEYIGAMAHQIGGGETDCINACYVFTSYFLTGENRPYDRNTGAFTRVKPYENFFRVRDVDGNVSTGKGAWEVGYRWSYIDFSDAVTTPTAIYPANGSRFSNHTVGVTWYLNPYTRLMLNDVYSSETTILGQHAYLNTVEMRAQIDF